MFAHITKGMPVQRRQIATGNAGAALEDKRVYNTTQLKIAGSSLLQKKETDVSSSKSQELKTDGVSEPTVQMQTAGIIQREKKKRIKYTTGGALGLGVIGAGIGSVVPGIGTLTGGLVGMVVGGIGGYLYSKPKIYRNIHTDEYKNELSALEVHQKEFRKSKNIYQKGTIVKYSKSNQEKFLQLLGLGNVLYTYDRNNQLSIGSGIGPMKHAIVAGNESVKAAGWAKPQQSQAQKTQQDYENLSEKLKFFSMQEMQTRDKALLILEKRKVKLNDYGNLKNEGEKEIVGQYKTAKEHLEYYGPMVEKLLNSKREKTGVTKATLIALDNESGHYQPGTETKDEAFEGWRNAGFTNLSWKSWKRKTN
jgi:hypothetical protein